MGDLPLEEWTPEFSIGREARALGFGMHKHSPHWDLADFCCPLWQFPRPLRGLYVLFVASSCSSICVLV